MPELVVAGALLLLALWGAQRAVTLLDLWRRPRVRRAGDDAPALLLDVTVQVPLYNEPAVAARVVDAVCALRWPRDRFEVQILDDSDDDGATSAIAAAAAARARAAGVDVVHLRRSHRAGFKAGALAAGLAVAKGDAIAIFDADFVPAPDFLERTVPRLEGADMVQARWGHLNRDESWLTRAQAALLDAHFAVEQRGRARAGRFFGFNGTAGVWRKSAIAAAGGWDARTLTEDLDLSVRAWLFGARFSFADDVVVPAELPAGVDAWRTQQRRWSQGALQTARARAALLLRAEVPWAEKADIALKLVQNLSFAVLGVVVVAQPIAVIAASLPAAEGHACVLGGLPPLATLALASPALLSLALGLRGRGRRAPLDALLAIALCAAMSIRTGAAAVAGLLDAGDRVFHRTPKAGTAGARHPLGVGARAKRWRRPRAATVVELAVGALCACAAAAGVVGGHAAYAPFLLLSSVALLGVNARPARAR